MYEETQWLIEYVIAFSMYATPVSLRPRSWDKVIFGPGLLSTMGSQHRRQRKVLNPVFSVAHMRHITPIFYDVGERVGLDSRLHVRLSQY